MVPRSVSACLPDPVQLLCRLSCKSSAVGITAPGYRSDVPCLVMAAHAPQPENLIKSSTGHGSIRSTWDAALRFISATWDMNFTLSRTTCMHATY